jgi:hypothetical protein
MIRMRLGLRLFVSCCPKDVSSLLIGAPGFDLHAALNRIFRCCGAGACAPNDGLGCRSDWTPPGNAGPRCEVGKLDPLSDGDGELEEGASSARTALAVTAMVAAMMRTRRILLERHRGGIFQEVYREIAAAAAVACPFRSLRQPSRSFRARGGLL